jgi:hypothetical protein
MRGKLKSFFIKFKDKLYTAVKRYPLSVALIAAAAIMLMIVVHANEYDTGADIDTYAKLAMSFFYGALLSLTIKSAAERFSFKAAIEWTVQAAVPAAILIVYFLLLPSYDTPKAALRYALLCALTFSLFFFIPFIKSEKSASYFAQKVLLRLAVTGIYYGIITGGAEAILFAIENLLDVALPDDIYVQVPLLLAGLFIPAFFFAGIPEKDDQQKSYPKLLEILLHYIVFPLLSIYSLVLYIYFIKILVDFELPSNLLGNLVIYYSLISVAAIYFGYFTRGKSKWTKIFTSVFPYVLILPTLMMLLSFIVRINQYGFTEPRYYAILCVIFVLRSISVVKLQKQVRIIPLVLSVLLLVSIFGPLSSFSVSKWSQNRQFEKVLIRENMLDDGKIAPNPDASEESKIQITSIRNYFDSSHSLDELNYIDDDFTREDMMDVFGFESYYSYTRITDSYRIASEYNKYSIMDVRGYDYAAYFFKYQERIGIEGGEGNIEIASLGTQGELLTISLDGKKIYDINMMDTLMPYFNDETERLNEYIFTDENDNAAVKIIVMSADYVDSEDYSDFDYELRLLFRLK